MTTLFEKALAASAPRAEEEASRALRAAMLERAHDEGFACIAMLERFEEEVDSSRFTWEGEPHDPRRRLVLTVDMGGTPATLRFYPEGQRVVLVGVCPEPLCGQEYESSNLADVKALGRLWRRWQGIGMRCALHEFGVEG